MKLKPIFTILLLCLISACEQSAEPRFEGRTVLYEHRGLKIRYPEYWSVESDGPSSIPPADRKVLINIFGAPKVSIIFFKTIPRDNKPESGFATREEILAEEEGSTLDETPIAGLPSLTFTWVSGVPPQQNKHKFINVQLRSEPYDVIIVFDLLNDDIEYSKGTIVPFIQSIAFDPDTIEL